MYATIKDLMFAASVSSNLLTSMRAEHLYARAKIGRVQAKEGRPSTAGMNGDILFTKGQNRVVLKLLATAEDPDSVFRGVLKFNGVLRWPCV